MNVTQMNRELYLTLHGVPCESAEGMDNVYFYYNPIGAWHPSQDNHLNDIESICINIHDALADKIFNGLENYYFFLNVAPDFLSTAGMNSESMMSKEQFISILDDHSGNVNINKALYLYDCRKLVSGIQETSKEILDLQGEFYRTLNTEELFYPPMNEEDGIRYITSSIVTKLFALLGFNFIRMHSLLDYATKLAVETENMRTDFSTYGRLASKNVLYGNRQRSSLNNRHGTLFETCPLINEIESIRNHLIHDGQIDDMPKAYKINENGKCVEKFILFPDQTPEGRFVSFKNRNLFYSGENKINLRLPCIIRDFQLRLLSTLRMILAGIA